MDLPASSKMDPTASRRLGLGWEVRIVWIHCRSAKDSNSILSMILNYLQTDRQTQREVEGSDAGD